MQKVVSYVLAFLITKFYSESNSVGLFVAHFESTGGNQPPIPDIEI